LADHFDCKAEDHHGEAGLAWTAAAASVRRICEEAEA
jgi:hypothetical protein